MLSYRYSQPLIIRYNVQIATAHKIGTPITTMKSATPIRWPDDRGMCNARKRPDSSWNIAAGQPDTLIPQRLCRLGVDCERADSRAAKLAIRFNACFEHDPLLPPELLPRPWPGRAARDLLARCRKHGVLAREDKAGPALFRVFDEAIAHLP